MRLNRPGHVGRGTAPRPAHKGRATAWLLDWRSQLVIVVLLLAAVGAGNIRQHAAAESGVRMSADAVLLRALLHEESNLQWRVLARHGPPLEVARRMGQVRRDEYVVLDSLAALGAPDAAVLSDLVDEYHRAIDIELGLLSVGRVADALSAEQRETLPLYERIDGLLVAAAAAGNAQAAAQHRGANLMLVSTMLVICVVLGALLRTAHAAHRRAAGAISDMLAQERRAKESLEDAQEMVRHQAAHDPLTGIANRLGLRERIDGLQSASGGALCVVYMDLDGFKPVNDRYGHERGDAVLCSIASALREHLRAGELPARIGGDEFVVVAEVPDESAGHRLAARLNMVIDDVCAAQDVGEEFGASVGVAVGPVADADDLLRAADEGMYRMKRQRREGDLRSA